MKKLPIKYDYENKVFHINNKKTFIPFTLLETAKLGCKLTYFLMLTEWKYSLKEYLFYYQIQYNSPQYQKFIKSKGK